MGTTYIGLDFETTGLDPLKHLPLTLGLAWEVDGEIYSHEFEFSFAATGRWDAEAMYVNELTPELYEVRSDAMRIDIDAHDWEICKFLAGKGWSPFDKNLVPVGWNVGGFDMRFMQTFFPQASKFFSHRYMELNSLVHAMELAVPNPNTHSWKREYRDDAEFEASERGIEVNWHNAEWDAIASLLSFKSMNESLRLRR